MRPIDVDALKEKFEDILDRTYTDDYAKGFVAGLYAALNMPALTPPNEWVSVEKALPPELKDEIASIPKNAIGGYRPKGVRVYHG